MAANLELLRHPLRRVIEERFLGDALALPPARDRIFRSFATCA